METTTKAFKIEIMAKELEIPIWEIKAQLGLPPDDGREAFTVEEAQSAVARSQPGSDERDMAMNKWIDLCTTPDEIQEAFNNTSEESKARVKAFKKWIDLCNTVSDIRRAYQNSTPDSKDRRLAFEKWISLCTKPHEAREASTDHPLEFEEQTYNYPLMLGVGHHPLHSNNQKEKPAVSYL